MSLLNFVKSKTFLKQLIIAIVGLVLLLFLLTKWLDVTTNHDQKIQVPDFSGEDSAGAQKAQYKQKEQNDIHLWGTNRRF